MISVTLIYDEGKRIRMRMRCPLSTTIILPLGNVESHFRYFGTLFVDGEVETILYQETYRYESLND
jgi:hypothetical protein